MTGTSRIAAGRIGAVALLLGLLGAAPARAFLPSAVDEARLEELRRAGYAGVPAARAFHLPVGPRPESYRHQLLVILVEFRDVRADQRANSPARIHERIFGADSTSLAAWWGRASRGRFGLAGLVTRWVTLDSTYAYYTSEGPGNGGSGLDPFAYPHNAQRMVEEAVERLAGDYDWSDFDNNRDGLVDGVVVLHAGPGLEENPDAPVAEIRRTLLAHQFHASREVPARGAAVFDYALVSENAAPGVVAHEFGHLLGLIDLYQTGLFAGPRGPFGLGDWSLMGTGALLGGGRRPAGLDGVSRLQLGFVTADTLEPRHLPLDLTIRPDDGTLRVVSVHPGFWTDREYFVLEARARSGDDALLPGGGLLIYHVDERSQTNSSPDRYRVALVQADGRNDLGTVSNNRGDGGDPYPGSGGNSAFGDDTTPPSHDNDGNWTGLDLTGIEAAAGGGIGLRYQRSAPDILELDLLEVREEAGDGDGVIEPGEIAKSRFRLCNLGSSRAGLEFPGSIEGQGADGPWIEPIPTTVNFPAGGECDPLPQEALVRIRPDAPPLEAARCFFRPSLLIVGRPYVAARFLLPLRPARDRLFDFPPGDTTWSPLDLSDLNGSTWRLDSSMAHSAPLAWRVGPVSGASYSLRADAALESPPLMVPAAGRLIFWSFMDAETLATGRAWDGGRIEITTDGVRWRPLAPSGGYPFTLEVGSGNPLYGEPVISGHDEAFRQVVCDLTPWAGQAIQIRFRFASDAFTAPAGTQGQSGWWVDDVAIESGGEPITLTAEAFPEEGRVRLTGGPLPSNGPAEWYVYRRPAWLESPPLWIGQVARGDGEGASSLTFDDRPEPGEWLYSIRPVESAGPGLETVSGVVTLLERVPSAALAIFPNPWRLDGPPLNVDYSLPTEGGGRRARFELLDVTGRRVLQLPDATGNGRGRLQWSGATGPRPAGGIYFLRMTLEGERPRVRRLVIVP